MLLQLKTKGITWCWSLLLDAHRWFLLWSVPPAHCLHLGHTLLLGENSSLHLPAVQAASTYKIVYAATMQCFCAAGWPRLHTLCQLLVHQASMHTFSERSAATSIAMAKLIRSLGSK